MVNGSRELRPLIRLLEADPELAEGLSSQEVARAERALLAEYQRLDPGYFCPARLSPGPTRGTFGFAVLDGHIARSVSVGDSTFVELLGQGDMICYRNVAERGPAEGERFLALAPTRIAMLDHSFFVYVARWPIILANLFARTCMRPRRIALQMAISHMVGIERKVLVLLWHFAERWGHVTPDGVRLQLKLTNELLGSIVGAASPTVSTAVSRLVEGGLIRRDKDGTWWLRSEGVVSSGGEALWPDTLCAGRARRSFSVQ